MTRRNLPIGKCYSNISRELTVDFENRRVSFDVTDEKKVVGGLDLEVFVVAFVVLVVLLLQVRIGLGVGERDEAAELETRR